MSQYDDERSNLMELLEELDERLKQITGDVNVVEQTSDRDCSNHAMETEQVRTVETLNDSIRDEIDKVEQAISRIDSGTYGICLICGQPIKKEQLHTMPYSFECTHCAKKSAE